MDCSGFINTSIYTPLEARVYVLTIITPSIWATLSALLINILLEVPSIVAVVISLSEGEIIPFSGVCQSGRLHYPRRRRWWLRTDWQTAFWYAADDIRQHHHAERRAFSALASANSTVYFASGAATSRWRICMSVIAAFASFSSLAFFVIGFAVLALSR